MAGLLCPWVAKMVAVPVNEMGAEPVIQRRAFFDSLKAPCRSARIGSEMPNLGGIQIKQLAWKLLQAAVAIYVALYVYQHNWGDRSWG
jgi:hypothetical protein